MKPNSTTASRNLVGQFVGYELKDGYKVKRLNLLTADGIQSVKLAKEARAALFRLNSSITIAPGTLLSLAVTAKFDDGEVKYKVYDLQILAAGSPMDRTNLPITEPHPTPRKITKIRVCDRGTCRKRGALEVYAQLQQEIADRGLGDQVVLEKTGCLKDCKHGPNVTIGKTCHSRICPSTAAQLLPTAGHAGTANSSCDLHPTG
jgi:Thioredoxin-like [2Fe-2S] ferredoxin